MECLIGIQFQDFVLVAADMTNSNSIMVVKDDEEKIHKISKNLAMAVCGESGDTTQFSEYIAKNIQLYKMRNGYELSPKAAASFTRKNLAEALRTRNSYHVNILLGGHDKETGPELYYMDYLASMVRVPYACHGYGGFMALSIMDRYHVTNMNQTEAYGLLERCVKEVHKRFIVNLPNFMVKMVNKDGIHDLPHITAQTLAAKQ